MLPLSLTHDLSALRFQPFSLWLPYYIFNFSFSLFLSLSFSLIFSLSFFIFLSFPFHWVSLSSVLDFCFFPFAVFYLVPLLWPGHYNRLTRACCQWTMDEGMPLVTAKSEQTTIPRQGPCVRPALRSTEIEQLQTCLTGLSSEVTRSVCLDWSLRITLNLIRDRTFWLSLRQYRGQLPLSKRN